MKLVEKKLRPDVFIWQRVPGSDSNKLDFLKKNFDNMSWIPTMNIDFEKNDGGRNIKISDSTSSGSLTIILQKEKPNAIMELFFVEEDNDTRDSIIKSAVSLDIAW